MPVLTRLTSAAATLLLVGAGQLPFRGASDDRSEPAPLRGNPLPVLVQNVAGDAFENSVENGASFENSAAADAATALAQTLPSGGESASSKEVAPLQIIGVLSASHMYTTYGYVTVTADALAKKVYRGEQVREQMSEVAAMCDNIVDQMARIGRKELTAEDARTIDEMVSIYRQLKVAAEALRTHAGQPTDKTAAEYETARRNVWPRIEKFLGLKPEK